MRHIAKSKAILLAIVLAGGVNGTACSGNPDQPMAIDLESSTGSIGLDLRVAPGVSIDQVQWIIQNPSLLSTERTGTLDVARSSALQFVVGGLPAGSGYTLTMTATTSTVVPCVGS